MVKCWRCGGGKTISMTTTGTHVLPCPTCGGSGESSQAQEDARSKIAVFQRPELELLSTAKLPRVDPSRTGSKMA
jgi:hypothetical protein